MSNSKNSNRIVVPGAREAMDKFKMEAANEVGVNLKQGYNGDPLDVLVLCSEPIYPMTLIRVYPIGVMRMLDSGKLDDKIIAVPFSDPTYLNIHSIDDLPPHIFDEILRFFSVFSSICA